MRPISGGVLFILYECEIYGVMNVRIATGKVSTAWLLEAEINPQGHPTTIFDRATRSSSSMNNEQILWQDGCERCLEKGCYGSERDEFD